MTVIISITVIIVRAFLELCDKVGGEVSALGPMVDKAFKVSIILTKIKMLQLIMKMLMVITPPAHHQAQREFLRISSMSTKPSDGDMATILKPTADIIGQIQVTIVIDNESSPRRSRSSRRRGEDFKI